MLLLTFTISWVEEIGDFAVPVINCTYCQVFTLKSLGFLKATKPSYKEPTLRIYGPLTITNINSYRHFTSPLHFRYCIVM